MCRLYFRKDDFDPQVTITVLFMFSSPRARKNISLSIHFRAYIYACARFWQKTDAHTEQTLCNVKHDANLLRSTSKPGGTMCLDLPQHVMERALIIICTVNIHNTNHPQRSQPLVHSSLQWRVCWI